MSIVQVDLDTDGFNKLADLKCIPDGAGVRFMMAGQACTAFFAPVDEEIELIPERSASHRALLAALQATQTGAAAIARAGQDLAARQADRTAFAQTAGAGQ